MSARLFLRVAGEEPHQQVRRDGWRRRARRRAVRGGLGDFAENSKEGTLRSAALLFGTPLVSHAPPLR